MSLGLYNASFNYDDKQVLSEVSFELNTNEIVGVIGPNGAGKSTIIKLLSRVLEPTLGTIKLDNESISSLKRKDLAKQIAVLPQCNKLKFGICENVWQQNFLVVSDSGY